MNTNPLAPPVSSEELLRFLNRFSLSDKLPRGELLRCVVQAFASIPYENLTKIIRDEEGGAPERARRHPAQVLSDHISLGTGGTCFALTATLIYLLRSLGWQAEPILADRRYGTNTHCALLVWIEGKPHLLDPGYLILEPVPLASEGSRSLQTRFNHVMLEPRAEGSRLDLYTGQSHGLTMRLTYKLAPVDPPEFLKVWDRSFDWDMMTYPLLTRVDGDCQLYLRRNRYQVRTATGVRTERISSGLLPARIERDFGISRAVAARAISILGEAERGDGKAAEC
jgi:arylamine N-acetyltransferase